MYRRIMVVGQHGGHCNLMDGVENLKIKVQNLHGQADVVNHPAHTAAVEMRRFDSTGCRKVR